MQAIDAAIDNALSEKRLVGAVVLVAQDGEIVYRAARGLADRERAVPMREDAVFRLASLTKPIVTAAALRLVERGEIALTDPVTRYLPAFLPALPDGERPEITLRHLLTHTAGLAYRFMQPEDGAYARAGVSDGTDAPGLSMAENLRRIVRAGLFYRPGESWAYSVAMDVMGAVLEQVQGLKDVLDDTIRTPLGVASLRFDLTGDQRARLVTPYAAGPAGTVRMPDDGMRVRFPHDSPVYAGVAGIDLVPARVFDPSSFRSGGVGLNGTAADMLGFLEAIRRGGAPIVSRESAARMMTPQTGSLSIPSRGPGWAFGFGGAVLTDPAAALSPQSPGTFGWGGVWGHSWFIEPARRLSVVSLTNTALEGMMGRTVRELRDAVCATFN